MYDDKVGGRKSEKLHVSQAPGRDFPLEMTSAFHSLHPSSITPKLCKLHRNTSPIFLGRSLITAFIYGDHRLLITAFPCDHRLSCGEAFIACLFPTPT